MEVSDREGRRNGCHLVDLLSGLGEADSRDMAWRCPLASLYRGILPELRYVCDAFTREWADCVRSENSRCERPG